MRHAAAAALVALLSASVQAQDAPDLPPLFSLVRDQPGDGPLSVLLRLRDAEATYTSDPQWANVYAQLMSQRLALFGDHAGALRWGDRQGTGQRFDSVGTLPAGTQALGAVAVIAERAQSTRAVMVNKAHNDAASRLLTLRLLPVLYAQGYRHFAAESFNPDVAETTRGGYPTPETGYYVGEPVFGAIVREAPRLGYTLVPYEIEAADDATVERDPEARVFAHAGYGHIFEPTDNSRTPMAVAFGERTGIDPLTVDQTALSERSASVFEHPRRRAAHAAGLLRERPVILASASGQPLVPVGGMAVDLQVLTPRTPTVGGRPAWPGRDDLRLETSLALPAACGTTVCLVESVSMNETDGVPSDRAVAEGGRLDAILVPSGSSPDDSYTVRVLDGRTGANLGIAAGRRVLPPPPSPSR